MVAIVRFSVARGGLWQKKKKKWPDSILEKAIVGGPGTSPY